ncbi:LIM-domain-containing protein [Hymenopellis radicata]|nr:LIM-domain-containing protein [Hymenopellis radicata]
MYATPRCAKCDSPVYAAEQVLGPARKPYHKPCLACTHCNKRLDSLSLLEHDTEPFCKPCHVKAFGTVDLRSANLPTVPSSPSRERPTTPIQAAVTGPAPPLRTSPIRPFTTGSPRFVAPATPRCAVCDKPVYHAEMVRALGRPYHRPCLRCSSCKSTLDPARLTDHDGVPMCTRCHSKEHGGKYMVGVGGR